MLRHFNSLRYFSQREIRGLLDLAAKIKKNPGHYRKGLDGKCVGLIFQKPSLRTKTAFYVGTLQLGGDVIYYAPDEIKLGQREKTCDVARNMSEFLDALVLRTFAHEDVQEVMKYATIPVINGLSSRYHPSQSLADAFTIEQYKGDIRKVKVAYIGDGNNVCNSLVHLFGIMGGHLHIASPRGYAPSKEILREGDCFAKISKGVIEVTSSPQEAAANADVLYTDVWISMGEEKEAKERRKAFKNYQINEKLLKLAKKDCIVMHCLPAHRGEEITDEVIDGSHSVVFEQAQNRLHTAKAILLYSVGGAKI